jgi:hypothetical protein
MTAPRQTTPVDAAASKTLSPAVRRIVVEQLSKALADAWRKQHSEDAENSSTPIVATPRRRA